MVRGGKLWQRRGRVGVRILFGGGMCPVCGGRQSRFLQREPILARRRPREGCFEASQAPGIAGLATITALVASRDDQARRLCFTGGFLALACASVSKSRRHGAHRLLQYWAAIGCPVSFALAGFLAASFMKPLPVRPGAFWSGGFVARDLRTSNSSRSDCREPGRVRRRVRAHCEEIAFRPRQSLSCVPRKPSFQLTASEPRCPRKIDRSADLTGL